MYDYINKEYIKTHSFTNTGLEFGTEREKASYMIPKGAVLPMGNKEKKAKLAKAMLSIYDEKFENYNQVEAKCYIQQSIMRKCFNCTRDVSRGLLAKFCVGAGLSVEEADKLFILQGYRLDPENNRLDAVVVDALKCGDGIDIFYEECKEYDLIDRTLSFNE
jgi:hypothetical protein